MYILDRFEEDKAVIEYTDENSGITLWLEEDKRKISPEVREGDVLYCKEGIYCSDKLATAERKKATVQRLKELTKCVKKRPL